MCCTVYGVHLRMALDAVVLVEDEGVGRGRPAADVAHIVAREVNRARRDDRISVPVEARKDAGGLEASEDRVRELERPVALSLGVRVRGAAVDVALV